MDLPSSDLSTLSSGGQRRSTRLQTTPAARHDSIDTSTNGTPAERSARSTPALLSSRSTPGSSRNTPLEVDDEQEPTPSKRTGLRRKREEPKEPPLDVMEAAMKPLTDEERRDWPGWVELESEPVSWLLVILLRSFSWFSIDEAY
jgi:ubiquitin carboxyl-terminal hydrolase L5